MTALAVVIVVLQVVLLAAAVWIVRALRRLAVTVQTVDERVGRVGAQVRGARKDIRQLGAKVRDSEVETGIEALNRYMLLARPQSDAAAKEL